MLNEEFWVAISFVIFVGATYKITLSSIVAMLDARSDKIKQELAQASILRQESENLLSIIKQKQLTAEKDISELMRQAEIDANEMLASAKIQLEKNLHLRKSVAEAKINSHKQAVVKELTIHAIDRAEEAVSIVLKDNIDSNNASLLIQNSLDSRSVKKLS